MVLVICHCTENYPVLKAEIQTFVIVSVGQNGAGSRIQFSQR